MSRKLYSNEITFVTVESVDYSTGIVKTKWLNNEEGPDLMIPHPYIGSQGEGIFIGLQPGAQLSVGVAEHNEHVSLGVVQSYNLSSDNVFQQGATIDFMGSPKIEGGEVIIQGLGGSGLIFDKDGGFGLWNPEGEGFYLSGNNTNGFLLKKAAPVEYIISPSGVFVSGRVRREIDNSESGTGLSDKSYEIELEEIGWDANKSIYLFSGGRDQMRNPPLVEERNIIFEYDNDFFVSHLSKEIDLRQEKSAILIDGGARRQRRNNILSLSLTSPNELIEKSSGTLVDFFGNILDINKKIISTPFETENNEEFLNYVFENMRHSVAYHMAINTRKGWGYRSVSGNKKDSLLKITNLPSGIPSLGDFSNNTRDRSKWEVNIDKEGLTVVNIPATSETGNVPRLVRYCTSSDLSVDEGGNVDVDNPDRDLDDSLKVFPNNKRQDIFLEQVGPGGIEVIGEQLPNRAKGKPTSWVDEEDDIRSSPSFIQVGTAFHDIRKTAKKVLEKDLNVSAYVFKTLSPGLEPNPSTASAVPDPEAISSEINVSVPDFNRPELLQKVYIQEEEVVVGSGFPIMKVKNKGIIKATDIKLWHLEVPLYNNKKLVFYLP